MQARENQTLGRSLALECFVDVTELQHKSLHSEHVRERKPAYLALKVLPLVDRNVGLPFDLHVIVKAVPETPEVHVHLAARAAARRE